MTFGSWKYPKHILDVKPFNESDLYLNISVDPSFSHNEWIITKTSVIHEDIEYLCCPDEYYPIHLPITRKKLYKIYDSNCTYFVNNYICYGSFIDTYTKLY